MAFVIFNLLCVAALVGLDQAIKFWAVSALQPVGAMPLIPHVVELRWLLIGCSSAAGTTVCSRPHSSWCWAAASAT